MLQRETPKIFEPNILNKVELSLTLQDNFPYVLENSYPLINSVISNSIIKPRRNKTVIMNLH